MMATCCEAKPVGKQPAKVAKPAGVGVLLVVEKMVFPANRSLSYPPNRNHLFFTNGPPMVPPPNTSLLRTGPLSGLHCTTLPVWPGATGQATVPGRSELVPGLFWCRPVLLSALRKELYSVPNNAPCQLLVPDLVMML